MVWKNRTQKDKVRHALMQHTLKVRNGKPLSSYLFLPGYDSEHREAGQCFQLAERMGLIVPQTRCVGYERKAQTEEIASYFQRTYPKNDVTIRQGDITRCKLDGQYDLAFLDFYGNIDQQAYNWVRHELAPHLSDGAVLALTLPFGRMIPKFHKAVRRRLATDLATTQQMFMDQYDLWGKHNHPSNLWGENTIISLSLFLVKSALRDYHVRLAYPALLYQDDGIPMFVLIFDQFRKRVGAPVYPDLSLREEDTIMASAAEKAVKTRRANALTKAKVRSNAAKKAWKTRRQATA